MTMRMKNATRSLAILVLLLFAIRHSMYGQTTTTNTDCTINGNTANCTSTSTDDSAQRQAQAAAQAEKDRQAEELGKNMGNAMGGLVGAAMRKHAIAKQYKAYCNQHPGESWARRDAKGTVLDQGTCPGTLSRQQVIDELNRNFQTQKVVGYTEVSGDTFIMHSERASAMRFHMVVDRQMLGVFHTIGIKTFVYTNDNDQRYVYDVVAGHEVTPDVPAAAPTAAPAAAPAVVPTAAPAATPSAAEAEPLVNSGSSGTATKTVASTVPQSAPAVAPAASPATATGTADTPKSCFTDKSGHTVCLAQH
jgi:hypothetical protein